MLSKEEAIEVKVAMVRSGIRVGELAESVGVSRQYLWGVLAGVYDNTRLEEIIKQAVGIK